MKLKRARDVVRWASAKTNQLPAGSQQLKKEGTLFVRVTPLAQDIGAFSVFLVIRGRQLRKKEDVA